jgi:hypothetical protein
MGIWEAWTISSIGLGECDEGEVFRDMMLGYFGVGYKIEDAQSRFSGRREILQCIHVRYLRYIHRLSCLVDNPERWVNLCPIALHNHAGH